MKGNDKVIELLNEVLTAELTAINQYFVHSKMQQNWGFMRLAAALRAESIDEMKHADTLIDRILFLEGIPNVQRYFKVNVGETVPEQLDLDLALEYEAVKRLAVAIPACREARDETTADLLEHILASEEKHIDWIETQIQLIKTIGVENYLAQQLA